ARGGKDAAQLLQFELQAVHFLAELRKLALRGTSLLDLLVQLRDLGLRGLDVLVDLTDVEVVGGEDQAAGEQEPDDESVVCRLSFQQRRHPPSYFAPVPDVVAAVPAVPVVPVAVVAPAAAASPFGAYVNLNDMENE